MFRYLVTLCLLVLTSSSSQPLLNEVLPDKELLLALVVNRHGERSPDADERSLSDQQELIKNLTFIEGPEGLTNMGKRRAFQIGKYYRQRYGPEGFGIISSLYLGQEISVRSTDKERTKMTAQVAMSAVYPPEPEQQWDEGLGKLWQPVPYTAVPLSEDYLRYYSNCHRFRELMDESKEHSLTHELQPYLKLVPFLKEKTGRNFTENPLLFQTLFDLFKSLVGLGLDVPEWAMPRLTELSEAARLAYRLYFSNDEMKKIGGGVLLNEFINAADAIIAGEPVSQRLRIISAHDFNIGALMEVSKLQHDQSIPDYGAVFALELYRSRSTGQYSVLPVYLPQAGESKPKMLKVMGCKQSYCDYDTFKDLTSDYVLPEKEFYKMCRIRTEL